MALGKHHRNLLRCRWLRQPASFFSAAQVYSACWGVFPPPKNAGYRRLWNFNFQMKEKKNGQTLIANKEAISALENSSCHQGHLIRDMQRIFLTYSCLLYFYCSLPSNDLYCLPPCTVILKVSLEMFQAFKAMKKSKAWFVIAFMPI